ncbi:MAG: hypothetical protein N2515_06515, partial [Deltaproteobacteria bacterium]|nr:hypothetical protein [Deltaproteobacteria bacterium]
PRSLEQPLRCPSDLVGDGHLDGRILGSAWWEMRELLGPERADAIVYASLASLLSRSTVSEAAQATISIAQAFFERGDLSAAELRRIHSLLQERGLLDCKRIIPLDEGKEHLAFLGLPSLVNGIGNGFAPLRFSIHVPEGVQSVDIYLRPIGVKEKIGILAKWDHPLQFNQPQSDRIDEISGEGVIHYGFPFLKAGHDLHLAIQLRERLNGFAGVWIRAEVAMAPLGSAASPMPGHHHSGCACRNGGAEGFGQRGLPIFGVLVWVAFCMHRVHGRLSRCAHHRDRSSQT